MCMLCGEPPCDVHEIARGSNRTKALKDPSAWLMLCRDCHGKMDGLHPMVQYAIKWQEDPIHYSSQRLNELRNRDPSAICDSEVIVIRAILLATESIEIADDAARYIQENPNATELVLDPLYLFLKYPVTHFGERT